jgi:proteasome lid subunit RPN8/RPN11
MTVCLSSELHARLIAWADAVPGREVCGLLFGEPNRIDHAEKINNISSNLEDEFEIEPASLIRAHRAARQGGPAVIGCFHSHPNGVPKPSPRDAASAAADGSLWLIIAGRDVSAWRAVGAGAIHDRFDPVSLIIGD